MSWRTEANAALRRLTGYELVRHDPGKATAPKPRVERKRSLKYALPKDLDDEAKQIIRTVRRRTMTSSDKLFGLISAVRYVVRHDIPGSILECGVWRGGSMQAAALALLGQGVKDRDLYLFDTFEGMPEPTAEDRRQDGRSAAELLAEKDRTKPIWAVASLEDVQQGMSEIGYADDHIHFVPGLVEETVPERAPEQIAILRLDTDWYRSTQHELKHLYPRLSPGGVLIIDDYGWWQGSRQATEEFLEETGARLLMLRLGAGRIAVKP